MAAFTSSIGVQHQLHRHALDHGFICRREQLNNAGSILKPTPSAKGANVRMTGSYGITLQNLIYTPDPTVSSVSDKDVMCNLVWKQVFGNAYVMESERAEAYKAESMYRAGQIPIKEFVRACALSSTYRRRFFECCSSYRAVELNFKHLLGRGPASKEELSEHVQRIMNDGYEADINSYIDSHEYDQRFGYDFIPGMIFKGTYRTAEEFNRMCALYSAPGTTDKSLTGKARSAEIQNSNRVLSLDGAGISSRTVGAVVGKSPSSFVAVAKGIPMRPDLDHGQDRTASVISPAPKVVNERAAPKRRYKVSMGNFLYMTEQEIAEYERSNFEMDKVSILAKKEVLEAEKQIELLQRKIAELRAVA